MPSDQEAPQFTAVTDAQADIIERQVQAYFDYTLDCFDRVRSEGNVVLQWLFGVIAGGLALTGTLSKEGYWIIAAGALFSAIAAGIGAAKLVCALKSQETRPPGNTALCLTGMLDESPARIRWRQAKSLDERIAVNTLCVETLATAVDKGRAAFAWIPLWFVIGAATAGFGYVLWEEPTSSEASVQVSEEAALGGVKPPWWKVPV